MKNGLEVLDKLLDDGLHDDPVVVLGVRCDHDRRLRVRSKGADQAAFQRVPNLVGQVEDRRL
jgi:hypothetical protein